MNKLSQTVSCQIDTVFSPFRAEEFDHALAFLSRAGFTGVEVAIARPKDVDARALMAKLNAHDLAVTTISTGQAYALFGYCLSSPDKEKRNNAVALIKDHIDLSAQIGCVPVTIGLLRGKLEQGDKSMLYGYLKEAMLSCIEYTDKFDVPLQFEPINSAETVLINTTMEGLQLLHELGDSPNVGLLYDTYHSYLEDGDMLAAISAASGRIFNVHFADSHRGLPGYGDIDFAAVYRAIHATGYTGAYALETLAIPTPEFVNEHCYESIATIFRKHEE